MGSHKNGFKKEGFILSVDIGTTSIRCHVYDKTANIRGSCSTKVIPLYPNVGYVEMNPDAIWKGFISVARGAVQGIVQSCVDNTDPLSKKFFKVIRIPILEHYLNETDAGVQMHQIEALGISTQRSTFTTWDRKTGVPFHNFISWQDQRAVDLVRSWNRSCTLKVVHGLMKLVYFVSRQKRCLAASLIVFSTQHITMRLVWVLAHYKQVRQAVAEGNCCFGTIDTWLLFKLTKGRVHATDYSNASATGIFDSYQMCWSQFLCSLVSLPLSIFPKVEDTGNEFGWTDPSIFGVPIPIMSLMADQQAAMFGECCFNVGDVKITMGTGTFMDINTGSKPHTSVAGLYPLVGWKIGSEVVYLAEGNAADTGTAIRWAQQLELFTDVEDTSAMAYSVTDSDGVCFVPSFSGLQAPLNDPKACASFMGLKPSTTKCHLVRAILESISFRNKQLYETMQKETRIPITKIRVDGGVSTNDFVMQLTADLFGRKLSRLQHHEMSCLGAAFVAGLGVGFWWSREELKKLQSTDDVFVPREAPKAGALIQNGEYVPVFQSWERALRRSMNWYGKT